MFSINKVDKQFTFEEKGKHETSNETKIVLQNFEMVLSGDLRFVQYNGYINEKLQQNQEDYFKLQMTTTGVAVI